ncbi:PE-PPE domain-containing protein [Gordonia sp. N1V]|uniref:PE-PPE domain-containing protein n=1 Tax=Gordonia sp. N1V TaxID=3034163 RepID=UPI0023E2DDCE|nr:PE-PPE domain-containing protein [Gordonia sp. N1V]MDF3280358.1 PE-PPE domain-containing protein [Gordonia sp. N1V]
MVHVRRSLLGMIIACAMLVVPAVFVPAFPNAMARASVFPSSGSGTEIYTIEPLDFNLIDAMAMLFQGRCSAAGAECRQVPTSASPDPSHLFGVPGEFGPISLGADSLDATLRANGADIADAHHPILVFAYSQGAQVAGFWLRDLSADADSYAPPATTSFLLVGDPENTYGPWWLPNVPTTTPYHVTEFWKEYDGWADWPSDPNPLAVANAIAGMMFIHPTAYFSMNPDDPNDITWTDGNTTYVMAPTADLPLLDPLRWLGLTSVADELNAQWKPIVDSAYTRPSTQAAANAYTAAASTTQSQTTSTTQSQSASTGSTGLVTPAPESRLAAAVAPRTTSTTAPVPEVAPSSSTPASTPSAPVTTTTTGPTSTSPTTTSPATTSPTSAATAPTTAAPSSVAAVPPAISPSATTSSTASPTAATSDRAQADSAGSRASTTAASAKADSGN